jgi:hypothetical protein
MTTPTGTALPALNSIAGTGMPGATVVLSGDVNGSGTVGLDGRWSINVADQPVVGKVSVTAVLRASGEADSPSATSIYTVTPPPPAVSSIRDGKHLRPDALPTDISGTAVDGADVRVAVDGVTVGSVQAEASGADVFGGAGAALQPRITRNPAGDARWSVPFPAGLAAGTHTLTVTQAVDAVASRPAEVTFIIDPPAVSGGTPAEPPAAEPPAAEPPAAQPPGVPAQPAKPAGAPVPPSDSSVIVGGTAPDGNSPGNAGLLASTGAGGLLTAAGLGAGALLLGAAFVAFGRLRAVR